MRKAAARIVTLAAGILMMLGLVVAPSEGAPAPAPAPARDPSSAEQAELLALSSYDIIRFYVVGGSWRDTYLRRGTQYWGYTHLVLKNRWNSTFDNRIAYTLRYPQAARTSGSSVTFEVYKGSFQTWSMRVVVQYGNSHQGIITAYYI